MCQFNCNLQDVEASCKGNYYSDEDVDDICDKNLDRVYKVTYIYS